MRFRSLSRGRVGQSQGRTPRLPRSPQLPPITLEEGAKRAPNPPRIHEKAGCWYSFEFNNQLIETIGAEEGIRTLDLLLGKETLYH